MALKNLAQLSTEIDSAVHTDGPLGKTTAPGLSALLRSLATEITILPSAYAGGVVEAGSFNALPIPGDPGKLYVVTDADALYRWSDNGYVALTAAPVTYSLPPATADTLGGVKVGANLAVADDGTLSTTPVHVRGTDNGSVLAPNADNQSSGEYATVVGGTNNQVTSAGGVIVGGYDNRVGYYSAFIGGGRNNTNSGYRGFIGAGTMNTIGNNGNEGVISGGKNNSLTQVNSAVVGGLSNSSTASFTFIGAGQANVIGGEYGIITGGLGNAVNGANSSVHGGHHNAVNGSECHIFGSINSSIATDCLRVILINCQGLAVTGQSDKTYVNNVLVGAASTGTSYALPTATAATLGGVKIGDGVAVASDGTLSVPAQTTGNVREDATNLYFTPGRAVASTLTGYAKSATNRALAAADSLLVALGVLEKKVDDATDNATANNTSLSSLTAAVGNKVDKASGFGLSSNDYTAAEKAKLAGAAATNAVNTFTAKNTFNGDVNISQNGYTISCSDGDVNLNPTSLVGWRSAEDLTSAMDAAIFRDSAGVLKAVAGDTSTYVQFKASEFTAMNAPAAQNTISLLASAKVDKASGFGLSSNDYTAAEKAKLAGLANYALPTATASVLGGIKVGSGLTITSGVLAAVGTVTAAQLETVRSTAAASSSKTAAYTLALADAGNVVPVSSTGGVVVTIPLNSAVNFPLNTVIEIAQDNTGQVTIAGAAGVTLRTANGLRTSAQWASVGLRQRAANDWVITNGI